MGALAGIVRDLKGALTSPGLQGPQQPLTGISLGAETATGHSVSSILDFSLFVYRTLTLTPIFQANQW